MKPKFIYNPGKVEMEPRGTFGKRLQVIWRKGTIFTLNSVSEYYDWRHEGRPSDIIAYRVIEDKS